MYFHEAALKQNRSAIGAAAAAKALALNTFDAFDAYLSENEVRRIERNNDALKDFMEYDKQLNKNK